jgi:UDP:flavonoid glycosyltransferase YjiC (YdhE family)
MLITLLAVGSQGDVRPFIALGTGLLKKGHAVRLVSHAAYGEMAASYGLKFAPVGGNPLEIVRGEAGQAWLDSRDNPLLFLKRTSRIAGQVLATLSSEAWRACQGSDAVIYSLPLAAVGYTMAEGLGVPGVPAALYPLHPTRAFPSILTPSLPIHGGTANWASGFAAAQLFWRIIRSQHDSWRSRELGLGPLPISAPLRRFERRKIPFLYGYSPSVIPTPRGWKESRAVCGYWFLDRLPEWRPPAALQDFLSDGAAPLYVGFGSMAGPDDERMTAIVLEAAGRTGRRVILARGWGGLGGRSLPDFAFSLDSAPHDWLFPRMAAVVHHGGAGTAAAALRAGVPSITVPFFADQFFWGRRVFELGAGPPPLPQKRLSVQNLEIAIRRIMRNPGMGECSRCIAERIRREDGVSTASDMIDRYLGKATRRIIH